MNVPDLYNATVIEKKLLSPSLVLLRIIPDKKFTIPSGSYLTLGLKKNSPWVQASSPLPFGDHEKNEMIRRPYFPTSSVDNNLYLEFYIHIVRSGELTPRLFHLEKDDRIYVSENPRSYFALDRISHKKDLLLVATGSAIAPYMSIIRNEIGKGTHQKFIIIHGARYSWDLGFRDELSMLSQITDLFQYIPIVMENLADPTWHGLTGNIQENFISGKIEKILNTKILAAQTECFLAGAPDMVNAMTNWFHERGFQKGQSVHYETFT